MSSQYSVYEICKTIGINRSSFSYWKNNGKDCFEQSIEFLQNVIKIYSDFGGIYGAPKIAQELEKNSIKCSVSKVSRAMKILGIRSIVSVKFVHRKSSMSDEEKALIVNLVKNLEITHINQVWTTDITYIKTINEDFCYLITYMDIYSKKVVSWDLTKSQTAGDMIKTLEKAMNSRNPSPGLIIHSDKGSQMRSRKYRTFLSEKNIIPSYTSLNHSCDENAAQESFHACLKKECIYQHRIKNYHEAYSLIYNYIENFYNPRRIHSSINYLSPDEFEKQFKNDNL